MNDLNAERRGGHPLTLGLSHFSLLTTSYSLLAILFTSPLHAEQLTLATQFPSPLGVYKELRSTGNTYLALNPGAVVGIGTAAPGAKLHVWAGSAGEIARFESAWSANKYLAIGGSAVNELLIGIVAAGPYLRSEIANRSIGFLTKNSAGTIAERFTIGPSGNVGIGTASPGASLDIADGGLAPGSKFLAIGDQAFLSDIDVDNTLGIYGNQNNAVASLKLGSGGPTLSGAGGNLGIGTTSPAAKLHVAGNAAFGSTYGAAAGDIVQIETPNPALSTVRFDADALRFWSPDAGGAEVMRITNAGNIGIGTADPQAKLQVEGNIIYQEEAKVWWGHIWFPASCASICRQAFGPRWGCSGAADWFPGSNPPAATLPWSCMLPAPPAIPWPLPGNPGGIDAICTCFYSP